MCACATKRLGDWSCVPLSTCACVRACVRACMRSCVHARVRACVPVCVHGHGLCIHHTHVHACTHQSSHFWGRRVHDCILPHEGKPCTVHLARLKSGRHIYTNKFAQQSNSCLFSHLVSTCSLGRCNQNGLSYLLSTQVVFRVGMGYTQLQVNVCVHL